MANPLNIRTVEDMVNQPNQTKMIVQQWSMQYDPNRVNDPTYMGGLAEQTFREHGTFKPVQSDELPPVIRDRRIFVKAPEPVYKEEEQPIPELRAQSSYQNQQKKKKQKPVFETLFGD
jgi:hypothetical protein